jgi:hypothetical protein
LDRVESAGFVMYRVVDDDHAAGGVVGDIGGHLLALRRRPGSGHSPGVSELGFEDREVRRLPLRRRWRRFRATAFVSLIPGTAAGIADWPTTRTHLLSSLDRLIAETR